MAHHSTSDTPSSTSPQILGLLSHAAVLQLVLGDEITRRDSRSATLRARAAGLDPTMRIDTWDPLDDLTHDRELLADLATLRFTEPGHGALIPGPVGLGKTHLACALGHIAIRSRMTVHLARTDKLFTRSPNPPSTGSPPVPTPSSSKARPTPNDTPTGVPALTPKEANRDPHTRPDGPFLRATRWSHHAGKRHLTAPGSAG